MYNYDLSVVLPAARVEQWVDLYNSIVESIDQYSFELICIGPNYPPNDFDKVSNFKFLRSLASPAKCFQMGSLIAEGEYICNSSDDTRFQPQGLSQCIDLIKTKQHKDIIACRYSEGVNWSGEPMEDWYFVARNHADCRHPGILDWYKNAPIFLMRLDYFQELGGLDCKYEQVNTNIHNMCYRAQKDGGLVYVSDHLVAKNDWSNEVGPVRLAYWQNDKDLFASHHQNDDYPINIDLMNWRKSPAIWARKFKTE